MLKQLISYYCVNLYVKAFRFIAAANLALLEPIEHSYKGVHWIAEDRE